MRDKRLSQGIADTISSVPVDPLYYLVGGVIGHSSKRVYQQRGRVLDLADGGVQISSL